MISRLLMVLKLPKIRLFAHELRESYRPEILYHFFTNQISATETVRHAL